MTSHRRRRRPKQANSVSLFCRIDNLGYLLWSNGWDLSQPNQGLKIFPCVRRDYPLPLPINRGSIDDLREEKIGSKVSQKTSLPPSPRCRFSSSASSSFFLRHKKPTPSPFLPLAPPWATSTTKRCQDHRPATTTSIISHRKSLSLLCKTFLLPSLSLSFQPPARATTISTTASQHNHQPTTKLPPRLSLFSFQPFSLLCNLFFFLPQPASATITSAEDFWATGQTSSARPQPPH